MNNTLKLAKRIRPFFNEKHGEDIYVVKALPVTVEQEHTKVSGELSITQELSPLGLFWSLSPTNSDPRSLGFGLGCSFSHKHLKAKGILASVGKHLATGRIRGPAEIGTSHKLERVTFHLPNFPNFIEGNFSEENDIDTSNDPSIYCSNEVTLTTNEWIIRLQPYTDVINRLIEGRRSQSAVLSGVGEIRKADGTEFSTKSVKTVIDGLRIFLSFSFAEYMPPLLVVGSNSIAEKSWQYCKDNEIPPVVYMRGWVDEKNGHSLSEAFPGFLSLWMNEKWREPITIAVRWLVETCRLSGGNEGAIAFGQIPLEMLAWMIFVDAEAIVDSHNFDKLNAASKIQMLLAHCRIPLQVPHHLFALTKLVNEHEKKTSKRLTGAYIATNVRNSIIHPNEKNRELLRRWERDYGVSKKELRIETRQLLEWYITLVLLHTIGHNGEYFNRLNPVQLIEPLEKVPWSSKP